MKMAKVKLHWLQSMNTPQFSFREVIANYRGSMIPKKFRHDLVHSTMRNHQGNFIGMAALGNKNIIDFLEILINYVACNESDT